MKLDGRRHKSDGSLDRALAGIESAARSSKQPGGKLAAAPGDGAPSAAQGVVRRPSAAFDGIDEIAAASLSRDSLARYEAYKEALLRCDEDEQSVIATLSLFVWDLFEGRTVPAIN